MRFSPSAAAFALFATLVDEIAATTSGDDPSVLSTKNVPPNLGPAAFQPLPMTTGAHLIELPPVAPSVPAADTLHNDTILKTLLQNPENIMQLMSLVGSTDANALSSSLAMIKEALHHVQESLKMDIMKEMERRPKGQQRRLKTLLKHLDQRKKQFNALKVKLMEELKSTIAKDPDMNEGFIDEMNDLEDWLDEEDSTTNKAAQGNKVTRLRGARAADVTDIDKEFAGTCTTQHRDHEGHLQSSIRRVSPPGTACIFGVDHRDDGKHCIISDYKYGPYGWCYTAKDRSTWGSCSAHCPLFGQVEVLANNIKAHMKKLVSEIIGAPSNVTQPSNQTQALEKQSAETDSQEAPSNQTHATEKQSTETDSQEAPKNALKKSPALNEEAGNFTKSADASEKIHNDTNQTGSSESPSTSKPRVPDQPQVLEVPDNASKGHSNNTAVVDKKENATEDVVGHMEWEAERLGFLERQAAELKQALVSMKSKEDEVKEIRLDFKDDDGIARKEKAKAEDGAKTILKEKEAKAKDDDGTVVLVNHHDDEESVVKAHSQEKQAKVDDNMEAAVKAHSQDKQAKVDNNMDAAVQEKQAKVDNNMEAAVKAYWKAQSAPRAPTFFPFPFWDPYKQLREQRLRQLAGYHQDKPAEMLNVTVPLNVTAPPEETLKNNQTLLRKT